MGDTEKACTTPFIRPTLWVGGGKAGGLGIAWREEEEPGKRPLWLANPAAKRAPASERSLREVRGG